MCAHDSHGSDGTYYVPRNVQRIGNDLYSEVNSFERNY